MAYYKYHDQWLNSYPITAEAMNHVEGQWSTIYPLITSHNHDTRYYTQTASNAKFFSTSNYAECDADMLDGYHFAGLVTSMLPIGAIMLWSGSDANVPNGWYVCDGATHGAYTTPNLIERFVVGAGGSYAVGATGGPGGWNSTITPEGSVTVGSHVLTTSEIPSHTHTYPYDYYYVNIKHDNSTQTHFHTVSTKSTNILEQEVGGGSHGHSGSSIALNAIDPRPAYYALYYIMKCA